ncbi:DedA family protein [Crossiella sp. CA-258035]|uniref:DedA family protein n=1 Tax=Crossiella sp. CA-258035 TaxID=2981138 RepID=UPI0024BC9C05|nr:DedA family protein [Crossiella sp. CA-258035]WHT17747.1 DedA family protein [Crossiella sp. CA-258035]
MGFITEALESIAGLPKPAVLIATGLLTFGECAIGLGFIVPGDTGLLVAATTVKTVPFFLTMWVVMTICAAAGDSVGYLLGRKFGVKLRNTKLVAKMGAENWDKATDLIRRRGAWAVFFARFLPVVRTLTPAAAGTSGLAYRKFLPASIIGATLWSLLHIGIGAGLGEAAKRVEGVLGTASWVLLAVLAIVITIVVLRKRAKSKAEAAAKAEPQLETAS